jgi:hypothetical protein
MAVNRDDYLDLLDRSAQRVPYWARSTNPIVRRHLGLNWRTIPPEITPILTGVAAWAIALVLSLILPLLQVIVSTIVIAAIIVIPFVAGLYGHILLNIVVTASDAMREEVQNDTLPLLRATPMSLNQILLGKVAVALWKRMDDLVLASQAVMFFTPPILLSGYATYWSTQQTPVLSLFVVMTGLVVCVLRMIIEPVFVGIIAVLVSVVVPGRSAALTASIAFSVFYFVMINLIAHLPGIRGETLADKTVIPPNLNLLFFVDFVLPLIVPIILGYLMLRLATRIITRD